MCSPGLQGAGLAEATGVEEGRGRLWEEAAVPKARRSIVLRKSPGSQAVPTFPSSRRAGRNFPRGGAPRHLLGSHANSLLGLRVTPGLPPFQACVRIRGYLVDHLPSPRVDTPAQTGQEGAPPHRFLTGHQGPGLSRGSAGVCRAAGVQKHRRGSG